MACYKEGFKSKEDAGRAVRNVKGAKRAYKCKECGKWHITSREG